MEQKKNVWCISKYGSPPKYGVGARLFYIAREFAKIGFETTLISSDSNHMANYPETNEIYNFEKYENLNHIWIKTIKYKKSASIRRFLSWIDFEIKLFKFKDIKNKKPDVVIVSSLSIFTIVYGLFLKKKFGCKLVFEIRDIHPLYLVEEFGVSKLNPMVILMGMLEKIGYEKADLIVGTMPNLKEHVKNILGRDKKVIHSPVGIHEIWYKETEKSDLVDALFPKEEKFIVGYAGSMGISNALEPFIETIIKMKDNKDVFFILVGDGDLKEKFEHELSGLPNVILGPKIKQTDIPQFLNKCDLLYFSAPNSKVWKYGQSLNKLNDYMMSGKPVVASYSGYESMLNQANSGKFVPSGNVEEIIKYIKIFKDMEKDERNLYGQRGKNWILKNHDYKNIALEYYKEIINMF